LNDGLLSSTNFTDTTGNYNFYMAKAVKLETTGSGSYFNTSQGIFQSLQQPYQLRPMLFISEPVANSIFSSPAKIKISTDLFDPSLSVSRVVFYNGDYKLGGQHRRLTNLSGKTRPLGFTKSALKRRLIWENQSSRQSLQ
jgi:hypothetical protein